jgi:uncharacterized membrane protein
MSTLTVLKFPTPEGAWATLTTLQQLQARQVIHSDDAAIVAWPPGKKSPKTQQLHDEMGLGAGWGALWGLLFGLLFFAPILGLAIGAGIGAMVGKGYDAGIDDNFIKAVRAKVTPGTSALFLMTHGAMVDRVHEALRGTEREMLSTNLPAEQEQRLREALAESEGAATMPHGTPESPASASPAQG